MIDLIYKIKNSDPTITGDEATELLASIVTNPEWVIVSSAAFGLEETIEQSNIFVNSLATIEIHGEQLLTMQPIHVIYSEDLSDGWDRMWGLLYSNGAVCYCEKEDNSQFVVLFLDQSLVDPESIYEIALENEQPNLFS